MMRVVMSLIESDERMIIYLIESDENDLRPTPVLQRSPKPTGGVWVISTSVSAGT